MVLAFLSEIWRIRTVARLGTTDGRLLFAGERLISVLSILTGILSATEDLMATEAEQIKEAKNAILVIGICLVGAVIAAVIGLFVFHVIQY
jgi:hypothetical protein